MRVDTGRWGEVTIKRQGEKKNKFDQTKSFSITNSKYEYSIEELKEVFEITTDLTEDFKYEQLKNKLTKLKNE